MILLLWQNTGAMDVVSKTQSVVDADCTPSVGIAFRFHNGD